MALREKSLFLYGFEVTELNNAIDFRVVALETPRQATIALGFYSLSGLLRAIESALKSQALAFNFTASANRTFVGGTENRVTISTTAPFFEILFATGPRTTTDIHALIGFPNTDQTGATTYTGTSTAGTAFSPAWWGNNYLPPDNYQKVFGSVNVSASGEKESIVWQVQEFWQVQFKYIEEADIVPIWKPFFIWAIQQRPLEFTPEITTPNIFYEGTLESTSADGKGLAFTIREMLPQFPFKFDTGLLKFRKRFTL